jgi:hypothetical protein
VVIFSVLVNVMDEKHAKIFYAAISANRRDAAPYHDLAVGILSIFPVRVVLANDQIFIFPDSQA